MCYQYVTCFGNFTKYISNMSVYTLGTYFVCIGKWEKIRMVIVHIISLERTTRNT